MVAEQPGQGPVWALIFTAVWPIPAEPPSGKE